ncbi:MAG TPA: ribbon-helix-helix protein, CopG family [Tepidisphaeraceae bacterium]|jgi:predicted transcriptional regulator|nr:ribbon-helix-helix protein, CopG family [Tepidisphaeraceae bacterium]
MSAVTIRIPPDLQTKLEKLCKRQHRSASDILRDSLRRYLVAEQLRELRDELRPYAEASGFLTDEDVFKAVS